MPKNILLFIQTPVGQRCAIIRAGHLLEHFRNSRGLFESRERLLFLEEKAT
jgi:hypothetical protein